MHDGPSSIAASFLPPSRRTNVRGGESFARDSSREKVFIFALFLDDTLSTCARVSSMLGIFFFFYDSEMPLFFCGLIFSSGIREGKKWRMKSRIFWKWNLVSFDCRLKFGKENFGSLFFSNLSFFFFFWICYVTYKGKLLEEENSRVKFILSFRKWNVFNVFWWKGLIIRLCEIYHILPFTLQLDKNDYICKMDGKIRIYIRLYRFFEFFILYQLIFYLTITIQFLPMIK